VYLRLGDCVSVFFWLIGGCIIVVLLYFVCAVVGCIIVLRSLSFVLYVFLFIVLT